MSTPKVLFILKYRETAYDDESYDGGAPKGLSSGLLNSAKFVHDMLGREHHDSKLVQVIDNNCIDREVHQYKPTHVIIEALWVVPEKFDVLQKLHPKVRWIVRCHSEIPFLANEGNAIDWICQYIQKPNVYVAMNSETATRDMRTVVGMANPLMTSGQVAEKIICLPNYYPHMERLKPEPQDNGYFDVACFGAIRPMKNHLTQAIAALEYADMYNKQLRFHINATRNEQGGNNNLKNLRALFSHTRHHLVEHPWMSHKDFKYTLSKMDIGLQVSFSESFNIVAADMVTTGLPIVVSPEIGWASQWCQANPTDSSDICVKMIKVMDWRMKKALQVLNHRGLKGFSEKAKATWIHYLKHTAPKAKKP